MDLCAQLYSVHKHTHIYACAHVHTHTHVRDQVCVIKTAKQDWPAATTSNYQTTTHMDQMLLLWLASANPPASNEWGDLSRPYSILNPPMLQTLSFSNLLITSVQHHPVPMFMLPISSPATLFCCVLLGGNHKNRACCSTGAAFSGLLWIIFFTTATRAALSCLFKITSFNSRMCVTEKVSITNAALTPVMQQAAFSCVFHFPFQHMMHKYQKINRNWSSTFMLQNVTRGDSNPQWAKTKIPRQGKAISTVKINWFTFRLMYSDIFTALIHLLFHSPSTVILMWIPHDR